MAGKGRERKPGPEGKPAGRAKGKDARPLDYGYCEDILVCLAMRPEGVELAEELPRLVRERIHPRVLNPATYDRSLGTVIQAASVEKHVGERGGRLSLVVP